MFLVARFWNRNDITLCLKIQNFEFKMWVSSIDLIVNRLLIADLSLCMRLKPTCDKKIEIMDLVYIINQLAFDCRARGLGFKPWCCAALIFQFFINF